MTDDPGTRTGGDAGPRRSVDPVAALAREARDRRLDLLTAHTALDEGLDAVDDERFDRIMALTDEVLELEGTAERAAVEAQHRADTRAVYLAAGVLGAGAGGLLLVGGVAGWWSGWAVVLLGLDVLVAAALAVAHATARWTGRALGPGPARAVLAVGALPAVLAPDWPPWWLRVAAVLALLVAAALALTRFAVPPEPGAEG
jgi:hypothetical protein